MPTVRALQNKRHEQEIYVYDTSSVSRVDLIKQRVETKFDTDSKAVTVKIFFI